MHRLLEKYIKDKLNEEYHTVNPSIPYNNSLQTLDNGNINDELKISKFYIINENYDYDKNNSCFYLEIKLRENYLETFREKGIPISNISYKNTDLEVFKNEKRNIINKIYTELCNSDII